jgi:uncharacterized protein YecE (DUF72 family)
MTSNVYIGCSGFHYKEWKNYFYPQGLPQSKWFQFYSEHFNTLELNVTFYKFPTEKSLEKWYATSSGDFMFAVKAPRAVTHFKKFCDCESMLDDFYKSIQLGLKEKLGCVLFQFPPQLTCSEESLQRITTSINPAFRNVLEFRHVSWWNKDVLNELQKHNIIFSSSSYPKLPDDVIKTNADVYYRLHGVPVLYKSLYSELFLEQLYKELNKAAPNNTWIYFNNTWGTSAIDNGKFLQGLYK